MTTELMAVYELMMVYPSTDGCETSTSNMAVYDIQTMMTDHGD